MSSRELILGAVRRRQPLSVTLPEVPSFDDSVPATWARFAESLARMGGKLVEPPAGADLAALIRGLFPGAKEYRSATPEVSGFREPEANRPAGEHADTDVGVVRAVFGVAETGSVLLTEAELKVPALGYLAQHLVVLLDPGAIVASLHHAYRRPEMAAAGYAVLMTGPSATADIEGVLIHGAQGVRSLTVLPVPRT